MQDQLDRGKAKRGILLAFSLGVLAITIIMAFTFDAGTLDALRKLNSIYLGYAVAAVLVSWFFSSMAFFILARIIKTPISLAASGRVYLAGSFFGFITPFSSGLLPTQIYLLSKENLSPGQATAVTGARAITASWLYAVLGLTILIGFRSSLPGAIGTNLMLGVVAVAILWSVLALYFVKKPDNAKSLVARILSNRFMISWVKKDLRMKVEDKIDHEIDHLNSNLKDMFSLTSYPALALVLVCEIAAWVALFSVLPFILFGLGWEGNFATLIFRVFMLFCLAPASPTPGGSGVVEFGFTGLLYDIVPSQIIGIVVVIWRALTYYLTLLVGSLVAIRFFAKSTLSQSK